MAKIFSKKVKAFIRIQNDIDQNRLMRRMYIKERERMYNSPEYLRNKAEREVMQQKYTEEKENYNANISALVGLKDEIFNSILFELNLTNEKQIDRVLDRDLVYSVMAKYQPIIDAFAQECLAYEKLDNRKKNYLYAYLYIDLIAINHIFIEFAPLEVFCNTSGIINDLSIAEFAKFKPIFEEKKFFENEKFVEITKGKCTGIVDIGSITNVKDASKELVDQPELFPYISHKVRLELETIPRAMENLLRVAPSIIKYMPSADLEIAVTYTPAFGNAIINCPDIILSLPDNFFAKHNPDRIFKYCPTPKRTISQLLMSYATKHAELYDYLSKYVEKSVSLKHKTEKSASNEITTDDEITTCDEITTGD